jgi:hypothetical protein
LGQQGFGAGQVLSRTYYDDYDFDNDGQPDVAYDTSSNGQFPAGAAPVADAARTTGLTTRTMTRVLGVAENDATPAAWLTTSGPVLFPGIWAGLIPLSKAAIGNGFVDVFEVKTKIFLSEAVFLPEHYFPIASLYCIAALSSAAEFLKPTSLNEQARYD